MRPLRAFSSSLADLLLPPDLTYSDPGNTSLLQCTSCGHLLDIYTTLTFPVLLVDLLLAKGRVYRHLLINRGPADPVVRAHERIQSMWRLGALVILLDACKSAWLPSLVTRS